jgi:DNA-binding transcriptional ArsR family regulator
VVPGGVLERWREHAEKVRLDAVEAALAHPQFVPGFLVPAPREPFGSIAKDLRRIAQAPAGEVVAALRTVQEHHRAQGEPSALLDRALARPESFRNALIEQLRALWKVLVAPCWDAHLAMLEGDVLTRGRRLALHGTRDLLDSLHDDTGWCGTDLLVDCDAIDLTVPGTADLLLVPSVFAWPKVFVRPPEGGDPTVLYYPARGAATLFLEQGGSDRASAPAALERLLGTNRARILSALDHATTTTELATRFALTAGGVSQHLSHLSALGLVRRTRVGRRVYYERVPRGDRMLRLFGAGAPAPAEPSS